MRPVWFFVVLLSFSVFTVPLSAQNSTSNDLTLRVALLKFVKPDYEALPFSRPVKLANGDQFRLFLQTAAPASMYVVYEDAAGTLTVLFEGPVKANANVYLPSETENFTLNPPAGTEKLYLVVSTARQTKLEKLLTGLSGGADASRAVLDEITKIKQAGSSLAEAPEKPVPMGGVTRGAAKTNAPKATEFQGLTTYVKTIRIEH